MSLRRRVLGGTLRKLNSVLDYLEELMANVDNHIKLAKLLFPQGQMWIGGEYAIFYYSNLVLLKHSLTPLFWVSG